MVALTWRLHRHCCQSSIAFPIEEINKEGNWLGLDPIHSCLSWQVFSVATSTHSTVKSSLRSYNKALHRTSLTEVPWNLFALTMQIRRSILCLVQAGHWESAWQEDSCSCPHFLHMARIIQVPPQSPTLSAAYNFLHSKANRPLQI